MNKNILIFALALVVAALFAFLIFNGKPKLVVPPPVQKPVETPVQKPVEKPPETPVETPTEKPTETAPPIQGGITEWDATCKYGYQGQFQAGIIHGINCNDSTALFPGTSDKPIEPFGDCVYLDNTSANVFFIPLKTQVEWDAFKTHLPQGVTLRPCAQ